MRKITVLLVFVLLIFTACEDKNAFDMSTLNFTLDMERVGKAVVIKGKTNLPDGFVLFLQVDAAPNLGAQATWAGTATINSGAYVFNTIFTDPLPYKTTCIISSALNPKYKELFTGNKLPFAVGPNWKVETLGNGTLQIALSVEKSFGIKADHKRILGDGISQIEYALVTFEKEIKSLDEIEKSKTSSLARFARLHGAKRRKLQFDAAATSFYYPTSFSDLQRLDRLVDNHFYYLLAKSEKDLKEMEKQKDARAKVEKYLVKARADIIKLQGLIDGGESK